MNTDELNLSSTESTFASPRPQKFSLPESIVYYFTYRPSTSSRGFKKLQKTCKYFYSKNPLIVCTSFGIDVKDLCHENMLAAPFRIWIRSDISAGKIDFEKIINKVYRFDAKRINFCNRNFELKTVLLFTAFPSVTEVHFNEASVLRPDGTALFIEDVFELFPKLVFFV